MRGSLSRPASSEEERRAARRLAVLAAGMELGAGARPAPIHGVAVAAFASCLARCGGRLSPQDWAAAVRLSTTYQRSVPLTTPDQDPPPPDDGFLSYEELQALAPVAAASAAPFT